MESHTTSCHDAKLDYWQQQIRSWKASGLGQKQYCQSASVPLSTFCYWKSKIKNQHPGTPKFYPLTIPLSPPEAPQTGLMLLVGVKQFQIEINEDFSPILLKRLIATLEEL